MIIVTGAAGFIGSCLVEVLNRNGFKNIILVDDFSDMRKSNNFESKQYLEKVDRNIFFSWASQHKESIKFIFHIGARTNTAEFDRNLLNELNLNYTKKIWEFCSQNNIP